MVLKISTKIEKYYYLTDAVNVYQNGIDVSLIWPAEETIGNETNPDTEAFFGKKSLNVLKALL